MENDSRMGRIAVFGYGSLVDPASAAETLGREVPAPRPVVLPGWRRRWSIWRDNTAHEKTFAIEPGGAIPRAILGLNVERGIGPDGEPPPNGALIEVTEAELTRLDLRELRYDRVDVTGLADPGGDYDLVVAFAAKPAHLAAEAPAGAVVLAAYLRTVEAAFGVLGSDALAAFHASTGPPPAPVVEAVLVHDEIPAGNPRGW